MTETSPSILQITANTPTHTSWTFDLAAGRLTSWTRPHHQPGNVLASPLTFATYRALTNNDAGGDDPDGAPGSQGRAWRDAQLHLARDHALASSRAARRAWAHSQTSDGTDAVQLSVSSRIAPPSLGWGVDVHATYRFTATHGGEGGDALHVRVRAEVRGPRAPGSLARFGLVAALRGCAGARWFGRGPGEAYRDRKEAQLVGVYGAGVDGLFTDYEVPQANGNRTDVRWVEFRSGRAGDERGGRLLRARFGDLDGASFTASRYPSQQLDRARHPFELRALAGDREGGGEGEVVWVHLDWAHHGLGTGSCGPQTLPQYSLDQRKFDFEIILD